MQDFVVYQWTTVLDKYREIGRFATLIDAYRDDISFLTLKVYNLYSKFPVSQSGRKVASRSLEHIQPTARSYSAAPVGYSVGVKG